jgi:hypothetical protein
LAVKLEVGQIIVGLDGYRVRTFDQYMVVNEFTDDPHMRLLVWSGKEYFEIDTKLEGRKFGIRPR